MEGALDEPISSFVERSSYLSVGPAHKQGVLPLITRENGIARQGSPTQVEPLSPRAYVAAVGIDRKTALADLRILAEGGLLHAHGTTTDRRYTLRDDAP